MTDMKHTLKDWIIATRPWSFPASAMPVVVTLAYLFWMSRDNFEIMELDFNLLAGLWALVNIIVFHAASNVWSDYHDYRSGVDAQSPYSVRALLDGRFAPEEYRRFAIGLLVTGCLMGLGLVWYTGWQLLVFGIAGTLLSLLYPTMKFHALGDLNIFLNFGLLPMLGTSFVAVGEVYWPVLYNVVPVGFITVAILHVNNTRDIAADGRAGIRTFAMLLGKRASMWLYVVEIMIPFLWVIVGCIAGFMLPTTLIVLLALPMAWKNARQMLRLTAEGEESIADLDQKTAKLQLLFSLLLSVGWILIITILLVVACILQ